MGTEKIAEAALYGSWHPRFSKMKKTKTPNYQRKKSKTVVCKVQNLNITHLYLYEKEECHECNNWIPKNEY